MRVRKVDNMRELQDYVDDYLAQGYHVTEGSPRYCRLKKSNFGTGGMHFFWFLATFWFTFGIGNGLYALYAYLSKSTEVLIQLNKND